MKDKDEKIFLLEKELDAFETAVELMAPDRRDEIMSMKNELMEEFNQEEELHL